MTRLNITALPFHRGYFDVIYCSHVLEHVPDDIGAMREIFRVLKAGGWFLPDVPILREKTFEDATVVTPSDRERIFGQFDHVRIYGKDFKERLEKLGFRVRIDPLGRDLGDIKRRYFGIDNHELYFCEKILSPWEASELDA